MKAIWKYPLPLGGAVIEMPAYTLAKVGLDPEGRLCVWVLHGDTEGEKLKKEFIVVGTGHPIPERAYIWLGTVTQGEFVWHIWT